MKNYKNSHTLSLVDENAPDVLQKLINKHHVDLVTARNLRFESKLIKRLIILNIKEGAHYENIIHVEVKPYDSKLTLDYDVLIDDNPNLVNAIRKYGNRKLLLYDQPWNKNLQDKERVIRVHNWNQIGTLLI